MNIGKALRHILMQDATITATLGERVAPLVAGQNVQLPFCIYRVVNIDPVNVHHNRAPVDAVSIEYTIFSEDYNETTTIAAQVRAVLDYYCGTAKGVKIAHCMYAGSREDINEAGRMVAHTVFFTVHAKQLVTQTQTLAAVLSATANALCNARVLQYLQANATITGTGTAAATVTKKLAAQLAAYATATCAVGLNTGLAANISVTGTGTAAATIAKKLAAALTTSASATINVTVYQAQLLAANISINATATAAATIYKHMAASISASATGTCAATVTAGGYPLDGITAFSRELATVRLRTAYTGSAFILRRSSDNATTTVEFDSNGKVSGTSSVSAGGNLATWIGSNDGFIDTWYDQSGNARNMVQANAANQLQLISAGTILDHAATVANSASNVGATTNIISTASAHCVYLVAATACSSGGDLRAGMFGVHDGTVANRGSFGVKLAGGTGSDWYLAARQNNTTRQVRGGTILSAGTYYTHYHNYTGSAFEMRLNNVVESETTDTTAPVSPASTTTAYFGSLYSYEEDGQKLRLLLEVQSDRSSDRATVHTAISGISW